MLRGKRVRSKEKTVGRKRESPKIFVQNDVFRFLLSTKSFYGLTF